MSAVASIPFETQADDFPYLGTNTERQQEEGNLAPQRFWPGIQDPFEHDFSSSVTRQLIVAGVVREDTIGSEEIRSELAGRDILLHRLWALFLEGEVDDLDGRKATPHAIITANWLVQQAARDLGLDFPAGSPSLDSEGGIRITWFRGNREVELACPGPSGPSPFIYHEAGTEYDLEERAGSRALVRWLQWLTNRG